MLISMAESKVISIRFNKKPFLKLRRALMNIKFAAGFLAGIILVVLVWYLFPDIRERLLHDGQLSNNAFLATSLEEKKEAAQKTNLQNKDDSTSKNDSMEKDVSFPQNAVETQIDGDAVTADGDGKTNKKNIQEQNNVSWAVVDRSSPEGIDSDSSENSALQENQSDTILDESKITEPVSDMDTATNIFEKKDAETTDGEGKFFFWKPFFLESKAKNFAAHITSGSNVNCLVDKIGTGNYQVYYLYKDEADKLVKAEQIKNTGITF